MSYAGYVTRENKLYVEITRWKEMKNLEANLV